MNQVAQLPVVLIEIGLLRSDRPPLKEKVPKTETNLGSCGRTSSRGIVNWPAFPRALARFRTR